ATYKVPEYNDWRIGMSARSAALPMGVASLRRGVFDTALREELDAFNHLVNSAAALDFGLWNLLAHGPDPADRSVANSAWRMAVTVPGWLWNTHLLFLLIYASFGLLVFAILGGAIARMAALHATRAR